METELIEYAEILDGRRENKISLEWERKIEKIEEGRPGRDRAEESRPPRGGEPLGPRSRARGFDGMEPRTAR